MKNWRTSCIPNNRKYLQIYAALAALVLAVSLLPRRAFAAAPEVRFPPLAAQTEGLSLQEIYIKCGNSSSTPTMVR